MTLLSSFLLLLKWFSFLPSFLSFWQHRAFFVRVNGRRRATSTLPSRILVRFLLPLLNEVTSRNDVPGQLQYRHPRAARDVQQANDVDLVRVDPVIPPKFPVLAELVRISFALLPHASATPFRCAYEQNFEKLQKKIQKRCRLVSAFFLLTRYRRWTPRATRSTKRNIAIGTCSPSFRSSILNS